MEADGYPHDTAYGPIHQLVYAFDDLYELQQQLCEIERASQLNWHEQSGASLYWNAPELSNSMAACVQSLASVAQLIEARDHATDRATLQATSQPLKRDWEELYQLLVPAFDEIFPQVLDVVAEKWDQFQSITGLPHSVDLGLVFDPEPSRYARVFLPKTLLSRFMTVAMLNLKTAAFHHWTREQVNEEARAFIEMSATSDETGNPFISLRVLDNGGQHAAEHSPVSGHHKGLDDIKRMAENFRAELIGPFSRGEYTVVELRMTHRVSRSQDHE